MGKKFNRLEHRIEHEYEKKGYSHTRAADIGRATAGKVYREQKRHRCTSCGKGCDGMTRPHLCSYCSRACGG